MATRTSCFLTRIRTCSTTCCRVDRPEPPRPSRSRRTRRGSATISNDQMRTTAQLLQDHGVNLVFNGHAHNYQRSLPIRARANVTDAPQAGVPAVDVDTAFDGLA